MPAALRYPLRKGSLADPQQFRVYRMESEAIGARAYMRLDDEMIRHLSGGICKSYGMPQVEIVWEPISFAADYQRGRIRLSSVKGTSRNAITIVHECAHHLHEFLSGEERADQQQPHGPAFMGCYMHILDTVRIIPVYAMRLVCERYRVKFVEPGEKGKIAVLKRAVTLGD